MLADRRSIGVFGWICFYALVSLAFAISLWVVYQNVERRRLGYQLTHIVNEKRRMLDRREFLAMEVSRLENVRLIPHAVAQSGLAVATPEIPVKEVFVHANAHANFTP